MSELDNTSREPRLLLHEREGRCLLKGLSSRLLLKHHRLKALLEVLLLVLLLLLLWLLLLLGLRSHENAWNELGLRNLTSRLLSIFEVYWL